MQGEPSNSASCAHYSSMYYIQYLPSVAVIGLPNISGPRYPRNCPESYPVGRLRYPPIRFFGWPLVRLVMISCVGSFDLGLGPVFIHDFVSALPPLQDPRGFGGVRTCTSRESPSRICRTGTGRARRPRPGMPVPNWPSGCRGSRMCLAERGCQRVAQRHGQKSLSCGKTHGW